MENDKKILACVDRSRYADYVADYAAWAAGRVAAPLELLHVLDRHLERGPGDDVSGAIGIDAQGNLLGKLAADKAARIARAREHGRMFLLGLGARALSAGGGSVDLRQRHGTLVDTLADQETRVRLAVLGHAGEGAGTTSGGLGGNVERWCAHCMFPCCSSTARSGNRNGRFRRWRGRPARGRDGGNRPADGRRKSAGTSTQLEWTSGRPRDATWA